MFIVTVNPDSLKPYHILL